MEIKLELWERFTLLDILPKEGNFATLRVIRKLRENLSLSEEEIKEFDVRAEENQIKWNAQKAQGKTKELLFEDFTIDLIKSKLKKMDSENKLEERHISLYEKFVGG